jgi:hypothetical protein
MPGEVKGAGPGGAEIGVPRDIQTVFEFLLDGCNAPLWQPWVATSKLTAYSGGVGATYAEAWRASPMRRRRGGSRVAHCHRPVLLVIESTTLPGPPSARFRLIPVSPVMTQVQLTVAVPPAGPRTVDRTAALLWAELMLASLPAVRSNLERAIA